MQVFMKYHFKIGTKVPFPEWPNLVRTFLNRNKLRYQNIIYHLEDHDVTERDKRIADGTECITCKAPRHYCKNCKLQALKTVKKRSACHQAAKELPWLGDLYFQEEKNYTKVYLTNLYSKETCTEDQLMPAMQKIYRRYGFSRTNLSFQDVDFFSRRLPSISAASITDPIHWTGSSIRMFRTNGDNQHNGITMMIDILYDGELLDPSPYRDAMIDLLPGVKYTESTICILDTGEKAHYRELVVTARPLVEQATEFFQHQMPETKGNAMPLESVSVASVLKRFCKQYGYTYLKYENFTYHIRKRIRRGHIIDVWFISSPSTPAADPCVFLRGLGFEHIIWSDGFDIQNLADTNDYFGKLFSVLYEAEDTVISKLGNHYPPTPEWYTPQV